MQLIDKLLKQKQILESEHGLMVAFIAIYGSDNYGLSLHNDEYQSDVDMKAVIVPTLDDLVRNSKPISKTLNTEWGQVDVKDIRVYFETLLKANPAYVETLFTKYCYIDPTFTEEFNQIIRMKEDLVKVLQAQFIRAIYGMMAEKEKALCHPYPSIAHKIEKWGYDGKQAHHVYRLWIMMTDYFLHKKPLSNCFHPYEAFNKPLMDLKLNKYSLDYVKEFVKITMEHAKKLRGQVLESIDESKIDYSIKDEFIKLSQQIIKNKIINEVRNG